MQYVQNGCRPAQTNYFSRPFTAAAEPHVSISQLVFTCKLLVRKMICHPFTFEAYKILCNLMLCACLHVSAGIEHSHCLYRQSLGGYSSYSGEMVAFPSWMAVPLCTPPSTAGAQALNLLEGLQRKGSVNDLASILSGWSFCQEFCRPHCMRVSATDSVPTAPLSSKEFHLHLTAMNESTAPQSII